MPAGDGAPRTGELVHAATPAADAKGLARADIVLKPKGSARGEADAAAAGDADSGPPRHARSDIERSDCARCDGGGGGGGGGVCVGVCVGGVVQEVCTERE